MDIKTLRIALGYSQRHFSETFGIPIGTIRNWEQGVSNPPSYVFSMIAKQAKGSYMVNVDTLIFYKLMEELAKKSKNGIEPFVNATAENIEDKIFFDENTKDLYGQGHQIVCDSCVNDDHHDIITNQDTKEYIIRANQDEEGNWYLVVKFFDLMKDGPDIIIQDGEWNFA